MKNLDTGGQVFVMMLNLEVIEDGLDRITFVLTKVRKIRSYWKVLCLDLYSKEFMSCLRLENRIFNKTRSKVMDVSMVEVRD